MKTRKEENQVDVIVNERKAAEMLGVSVSTMSRWLNEGRIVHAAKVQRVWFVNMTREFPELFGEYKKPATVAADAGGAENGGLCK